MITSTNENASSTSSTRPSSSLSEFNIQDANNHRGVLGEDSTGTSRQSSRSVTPAINVVYCENSKVERECTKRSASNHLDDQVCLLFCCIVILSILLYHRILSCPIKPLLQISFVLNYPESIFIFYYHSNISAASNNEMPLSQTCLNIASYNINSCNNFTT